MKRNIDNKIIFIMSFILIALANNSAVGQANKKKGNGKRGEYSVNLFPIQTVDSTVYQFRKNENEKRTGRQLLLKLLQTPYRKLPTKRSPKGGTHPFLGVAKISKRMRQGKQFTKYQNYSYLLVEKNASTGKKILKTHVRAGGVKGRSTLNARVVWHPQKNKIFIVKIISSHSFSAVHNIHIYKLEPARNIGSFPFRYDTYRDWPDVTHSDQHFELIYSGQSCAVKSFQAIAIQGGIVLYCERSRSDCPPFYLRYRFNEEDIHKMNLKQADEEDLKKQKLEGTVIERLKKERKK